MSTLKGYNSNPKTLSGIVDVVADTAQVGGITINNDNINGISNFTATDITCSSLTATTITGGTITYTTATINDLVVNDSTLIDCDMNLTTGNSYNINSVDVLNATTLGSSVVNSSLTSLGTLTGLSVGGNITQSSGTASLRALTVPSISCSGNISGTLTTASQPNITSLGTLTGLTVGGNISQSSGTASLQALTVPSISCSGNISGTLTTASQPNITSFGTLTGLTVGGNITQSSGTTTLNELQVNGDTALLDTVIVGKLLMFDSTFTTELDIIPAVKDITSNGNYVSYKIDNGTTSKSHYFLNLVEIQNTLTLNGNITQTAGTASLRALTVPSISCSGNISGTLTTASQPNLTSLGTLTGLTVGGNITQSSGTASLQALTVPSISCSGNISGTLTTASQPNITSLGTLTGLTVGGNITQSSGTASLQALTVPSISCSGNVSGTLTTASQPNITSLGTLTGLSVSGNITHGSLVMRPNTKGTDVLSNCETIGNEQGSSSFANLSFTSNSDQGYTFSATSTRAGGFDAYHGFGTNIATVGWASSNLYTVTTGLYTGSTTTIASGVSYSGERLTCQLPSAIVIKSITFTTPNNSVATRSKDLVWIASNDGTTWSFLQSYTSVSAVASATITFTSGFGIGYNRIAVIVQNLTTVAGSGSIFAAMDLISFTGWVFPSITQSVYIPQTLEVGRTSAPSSLPTRSFTVNGNTQLSGLLDVVHPTSGLAMQIKPGYKFNELNSGFTTYEMPGTQTHLFWDNVMVSNSMAINTNVGIDSNFPLYVGGFARFRLPCFLVWRTGSFTASLNASLISSFGTIGFDYNPSGASGTGWNTSIGMYGVGASTTGMQGVYHFDVYIRAADSNGNAGIIPQIYNSLTVARTNVIKTGDGTWWIPRDPSDRRSGMFSCNIILGADENFLVTPNASNQSFVEVQVSGHFVSHSG